MVKTIEEIENKHKQKFHDFKLIKNSDNVITIANTITINPNMKMFNNIATKMWKIDLDKTKTRFFINSAGKINFKEVIKSANSLEQYDSDLSLRDKLYLMQDKLDFTQIKLAVTQHELYFTPCRLYFVLQDRLDVIKDELDSIQGKLYIMQDMKNKSYLIQDGLDSIQNELDFIQSELNLMLEEAKKATNETFF